MVSPCRNESYNHFVSFGVGISRGLNLIQTNSELRQPTGVEGVHIGGTHTELIAACDSFSKWLRVHRLESIVEVYVETNSNTAIAMFRLREETAQLLAPEGNTMHLRERLKQHSDANIVGLEQEILVAMLLCPVRIQFPSYDEFTSAIRIRQNIVDAAQKTTIAFATNVAERPADFWSYDEDRGVILLPGKSLITALQKATQPSESGQLYTFSCRRAVEYILLLALTMEAKDHNRELYIKFHQQAETRAIKGGEFERVYIRTLGSVDEPLPAKYFIPGDRTWFRNPDQTSSEVLGFEGSWTYYLGGDRFADFWRTDNIYTLATKCLTIFHWRNATYSNGDGELQVNEKRVEELVQKSLSNPRETEAILDEMLQLQAPMDTFTGGSIESHREFPRHVFRGSADIVLPDVV